MSANSDVIHSRFWQEQAEGDNPFAAAQCRCAGYDVYGDLLGKISWSEYWYVLFKHERPQAWQTRILDVLAVALANPGPRDPSVHAAMTCSMGGGHAAASLMAALGVGAGVAGGGRDVYNVIRWWNECGTDLELWRAKLMTAAEQSPPLDVWRDDERIPGFDPYGASCTTPVRQTLDALAVVDAPSALRWLQHERATLECLVGQPLAMSGVAGAALAAAGFSPDEGEAVYLLLRLPGAAAHALEQRTAGWKRFPFWRDGVHLAHPPGEESMITMKEQTNARA